MTARFARNADVGTSAPPLRAVRRDAAPSRAEGSEQMRKLVAQSAIDFHFTVCAEPAIQEDARGTIFGATGRAAQPGRPFHADICGQGRGVVSAEELDCDRFQYRIAA